MYKMLLQIPLEMSTSNLQISSSCFITYILYPYKCKYISNVLMLLGDSLFLVFSITGCCERTLVAYVAAGRLTPGFAAWLRPCIPGGLRHLLVEVWIGGHSADHAGKKLRKKAQVCLLGAWSQAGEDLGRNIVHPPAFRKVNVLD